MDNEARVQIAKLELLLARADEIIRNARPGVREGMAGEKQTELWFKYADAWECDYATVMEKR